MRVGGAASAAIAGLTLVLALWPGFALIVALATESANSACVLNAGQTQKAMAAERAVRV